MLHSRTYGPIGSLAIVLLLGAAASALADSQRTQQERTGRAYSLETERLIYVERHRDELVGGEVTASEVVYSDADGDPFAFKQIDFAPGSFAPDFILENRRTGHSEGIVSSGVSRELIFRGQETEALSREVIEVPELSIIDAGFDRFIDQYWSQLIAGERYVVPFLVPSRSGFVDFGIRRDATLESSSSYAFVLEIDSVMLRWLVGPIVVSYDRATGDLVRYEGVSNMRDPDGRNYKVRIEFDHGVKDAIARQTAE